MSRCLIFPFSFLAASATAFWFYGGLRTMAENVGFDPWVTTTATLITVIFAAAFVFTAVAAGTLAFREVRARRYIRLTVLACVAGVVAGVVVGEAYLLVDEARFEREARTVGQAPYARSRAWPFEDASLVRRPGGPTHATD